MQAFKVEQVSITSWIWIDDGNKHCAKEHVAPEYGGAMMNWTCGLRLSCEIYGLVFSGLSCRLPSRKPKWISPVWCACPLPSLLEMGWTEEGLAKMMMSRCWCHFRRPPALRAKLLPMSCRSSPCSPSWPSASIMAETPTFLHSAKGRMVSGTVHSCLM